MVLDVCWDMDKRKVEIISLYRYMHKCILSGSHTGSHLLHGVSLGSNQEASN